MLGICLVGIDGPARVGEGPEAVAPDGWMWVAWAVPGKTVLVQGVGGGVDTVLIQLGRAAGLRVWATARDPKRGERLISPPQRAAR